MEKIEQLMCELTFRMNHLESEIKRYKGSFEEDFNYAFKWYAEPMYKSDMELKALCKLANKVKSKSAEDIADMLRNYIERIESDLLDGQLQGMSSSLAMNTAHTWKLEKQQQLRAMFIRWKNCMTEVK